MSKTTDRRIRAGRAAASTVQLRERGVVTLPKRLRDRYGLGTGDVLSVLDLDGVFVLSPRAAVVPELAAEIERLRVEAGLSTDELLAGLRAERARYARERYGDAFVDGLPVPDASSPDAASGAPAER
jgi:bifunctional DNA-binding transcriptional regulator/antitoxin component of YhaV-PrlF toxin-antitoxin module